MLNAKPIDESDDDVPASERGKGENMSMEDRSSGMVFGLVGLRYFAVLLLVLSGLPLYYFL